MCRRNAPVWSSALEIRPAGDCANGCQFGGRVYGYGTGKPGSFLTCRFVVPLPANAWSPELAGCHSTQAGIESETDTMDDLEQGVVDLSGLLRFVGIPAGGPLSKIAERYPTFGGCFQHRSSGRHISYAGERFRGGSRCHHHDLYHTNPDIFIIAANSALIRL